MTTGDGERRAATTTRSQRVHELGLKLIVLLLLAAAAFLGTRMLAIHVRGQAQRDASVLHARGTAQLRDGQVDAALTSLRGASSRDRQNATYTLTYAQALRAQGQLAGAERVLLLLRSEAPDQPEVNLELARLAADQGNVEMAVRYYRYALYAPWPAADGPQRVREELVTFLLQHGDRTRATSELVGARATIPDDPAAHLHLGTRFIDAGEPRLALDEFRRALQLAPDNRDARRAAGRAAYQTGDYRLAASMLADAGDLDADSARDLAVARAVVTLDPLSPRLSAAMRMDRTVRLLTTAATATAACDASGVDAAAPDSLESWTQRVRRSRGQDLDVLADALAAAATHVKASQPACTVTDPAVTALLILGARQQETVP